ncbi:MAG: hypothetical protein R3C11_08180 [Planctomycetaceae bacterium]
MILTARSEEIWTTLLSISFALLALLAGWICYRYCLASQPDGHKTGTGLLLLASLFGLVLLLVGTYWLLGVLILIAALIAHQVLKGIFAFKKQVN